MDACLSLLSRAEIDEALWLQIGRIRYATFVEALGWTLPANHEQAIEFDEFDDLDTTRHVVWSDGHGQIIAYTRVTPGDSPNVSATYFKALFEQIGLPASRRCWELSRMLVAQSDQGSALSVTGNSVILELLATARTAGVDVLFGVTFESLIRRWRIDGLSVLSSRKRIMTGERKTCAFHLRPFGSQSALTRRLDTPTAVELKTTLVGSQTIFSSEVGRACE